MNTSTTTLVCPLHISRATAILPAAIYCVAALANGTAIICVPRLGLTRVQGFSRLRGTHVT